MLAKNDNLIENICEVSLRSVWGSAFPDLAAIYTSLSKIKWTSEPKATAHGILYNNELRLSYPGLNQDQFNELDKLIRGMYLVRVTTEEGSIYELAGDECPMAAEVKFNGGQTDITFSQEAIEPVKYFGNQENPVEELGFPYTLSFTLP